MDPAWRIQPLQGPDHLRWWHRRCPGVPGGPRHWHPRQCKNIKRRLHPRRRSRPRTFRGLGGHYFYYFYFPTPFFVGFLFLILYPGPSPPPRPPPACLTQHNFVTHHLSHTITHLCQSPSFTHHLSHTIISHTPSLTHFVTHNFDTHHLSHAISLTHHHTSLSTTIFHTPSFSHHHLSHTVSHTLCHTQLWHPPSFTHHLSHTISHTPGHRHSHQLRNWGMVAIDFIGCWLVHCQHSRVRIGNQRTGW